MCSSPFNGLPTLLWKVLSRSCSSQFPFYFDTVWFFPGYRTLAVSLSSSPCPFLFYWQCCVHHTSKADSYRTLLRFSRDQGSEAKQSALKSPGLLSSLEAGPSFPRSHQAGLLLGTLQLLGPLEGVTRPLYRAGFLGGTMACMGNLSVLHWFFFFNLIALQSVLKSSKRKKKGGAGLALLEINLALLLPFSSGSLLFDKCANAA